MKLKLPILLPSILLSLAFIVYLSTMPPSILWVDSGTMIAASKSLGIPNPPGFPFYMMASHIFTFLPISAMHALQLFTITFSLGLLFLVYKIILLLIQNDFFFHKPATSLNALPLPLSPHIAAFFGAISLAFSYQYWSQSQNTESFIFTYFFITLFAYLMIRLFLKKKELLFRHPEFISGSTSKKILNQVQNDDSKIQNNSKTAFNSYSQTVFKTLLLLAFLHGLAAGANPTSAAFVPGVLYFMFLNRQYLNFKKLVVLGLTFAITVSLVYSYLPLRASSWPFVNWGNPQTWKLFVGHLHGEGLNIYEPESGSINGYTGSPLVFVQSVSYFFFLLFVEFTPLLVPFLIAGLYFVFKKNKYLFWFLLSVPIINVFYAGIYYSGNQESWFILSWIFAAVFIGIGFYHIINLLNQKTTNGKWKMINGKLLFSLCFLPLLVWFIPLNRSSHTYASDYTKNLYGPLEKNAILLGTGDFFNSLSNYLKVGDTYRDDVTPITVNVFYVNKWSRDTLRHASNIKVDDKLEDIIQYKSFSEYNDAMNKLIADNIDKHPIYVIPLALRASALAATDGGQLRVDPKRFKLVPHGLSLQIVKVNQKITPDMSAFNFAFSTPITKAPFYLERNYRGGYKNILNDYVYAYEALGDWYAEQNDNEKTLLYYRKALSLEPDNAEVLAHIGEYYARKNDFYLSSQYLQKATILSGKNPAIHFNLGLSYAHLGKNQEARNEFEAVKQLAPYGDPIVNDAQNIINTLPTQNTENDPNREVIQKTASWNNVIDKDSNFGLKVPPQFIQSKTPAGLVVLTEQSAGKQALTIAIVGHKLAPNDNIDQIVANAPIKLTGILLDTQRLDLPGFQAVVQVFGNQQGDSSQRFLLRRNNWLWIFKVSPGSAPSLSLFYDMLKTFRPLEE